MSLNPIQIGIMIISLSIIVVPLLVITIAGKRNKMTRENSLALQAELFCFRYQRKKSGYIPSNARAMVDSNIPNLHKYGHLIPNHDGGIYSSQRRGRRYRPIAVVNVNGENRLVPSRIRYKGLKTADLGKQISILYRKTAFSEYFIFNDDESLSEVSKMKHILQQN